MYTSVRSTRRAGFKRRKKNCCMTFVRKAKETELNQFHDVISQFSAYFYIRLRRYIKHSRHFTTFAIKLSKFSTLFSVIGNVLKHILLCLIWYIPIGYRKVTQVMLSLQFARLWLILREFNIIRSMHLIRTGSAFTLGRLPIGLITLRVGIKSKPSCNSLAHVLSASFFSYMYSVLSKVITLVWVESYSFKTNLS